MIFVDTGAWFASVVPDDTNHRSALTWLTKNRAPLLTTDYIVDETLTLLRARSKNSKAIELGQLFFSGQIATVYYLTQEDIEQGWETFLQYRDKAWSFTDCTSKVVLEKFGIKQAFAFDHHFQQFRHVQVVP